jgi:hypothetical protein
MNYISSLRYVFCLMAFSLCVVFLSTCAYAQEFKSGDKIEVEFLGKWYVAEVTEIVKEDVMLKATFTDQHGKLRTGFLFAKRSYRALTSDNPDEAKVGPASRKWTSADGKFSTTATFVEMDGENAKLKKEDGTVISVPLESLSRQDVRYVKNLTKDTDSNPDPSIAGAQGLIPTNQGISLDQVPMIDIDVASKPEIFPVDIPGVEIADRKIALGEFSITAKFKDLVFDRSGLTGFGLLQVKPGPRGPTDLYVVDMKTGKVKNRIPFPVSLSVLCDVSSDGSLLLTRSTSLSRDRRVDLWKWTGSNVEHFASWSLPENSKEYQTPDFASFTHDDNVVTLSKGGHLVIWKTDPLEPVAKLKTDFQFSEFTRNSFQVSRDRKYMYCVLNGKPFEPARFISVDMVNHKCLGSMEIENKNNSLAISPSGQRIAILGKSILTLYDQQMNVVDEMSVPFEGYRDRIRWLDERYLTVRQAGTFTLFDSVTRVPLWKYSTMALVTMGGLENLDLVIDHDGKVWVCTVPLEQNQLCPLKVPHEAAIAKIPADPDSVLLFKQGMTASIELNIKGLPPDEIVKINDHFQQQFANHGIQVVPNGAKADLRLVAGSELGDIRKVDYEDDKGNVETVTNQKTYLTIQIFDQHGLAWKRVGSSGGDAMPIIIVPQGQTAQSSTGGAFTNQGFYMETRFPKHVVRQPPNGAYGFSEIKNGDIVDTSK